MSSCRWSGAARDGACGVRLDVTKLATITERVLEEIGGWSGRSGPMRMRNFVIGSPQQLAAILFEKLGLSKKRKGRPVFPRTRGYLRRSATSIRSSGESSAGASFRRW